MPFKKHALIVCALSILLSACSTLHYPVNPPLQAYHPDTGYRLKTFIKAPGDEDLLMVVTFSGGGSRAAALGYGVLEALAKQKIQWKNKQKSLVDEVDLMYGVSGGSMVAASYALHGNDIFNTFVPDFLEKNLQKDLIGSIISAAGFWRIASPDFGRGDLLQQTLDNALFHGATFADLSQHRKGPFVVISATDLADGTRFDFMQEYFDLICSDLNQFPVARAVAASSSLPLVFAPISMWNYAGSCGFTPAQNLQQAADTSKPGNGISTTQQELILRDLAKYLNRDKRPYLHLIDGGVSDNLALRGLLEIDSFFGDGRKVTQWLGIKNAKKLVFISVDAGTDNVVPTAQSPHVPKVVEVGKALSDILVDRYSGETRLRIHESFQRWQEQSKQFAQQEGREPPEFYFIDIAIRNLPSGEQRTRLMQISTSLFLEKPQVRELRTVAGELLNQSPDFQRLIQQIGVPKTK